MYETLPDDSASCGVCERRCLIPDGGRGFCGSRMNFHGRLYSLTYGDLTSVTNNPIEKKPLFHYWPGSRALSAGSWGCNLRCVYCQNHSLTMVDADPRRASYTSPDDFVSVALKMGSEGLSFTFNEASCTLLEYIADCYRIAAPKGLYCNLNTNGYMTADTLEALVEAGMDSLCVDIKGDKSFYRRFCNGADPEPVWRNAAEAKRKGLHVEMINLVVPRANDGEKCLGDVITRTRDKLSPDTPLHFTRFYPAHRASEYGLDSVTPLQTLEGTRGRALEEGLEYVYTGNVPGHPGEDTNCPGCGRLLIDRYSFSVLGYFITDDGRCPDCGKKIPVVGKPIVQPSISYR